ncbi:uncharacterized protein M421DRAFT_416799 [Didymella exigua CBS 183.55]|uniref:Uncharacterized protein n=1 Tax=Didymella exigua CBS 183.55 TaxID=1150837 RepID=A0A6A5RW31_9PLEO|nr:uncharacterized protein M421DRAFT_416799 [Didymella exigua CBS 183.55]KAF1932072.1 hypothetical protein M421DRAFT_416799 [Didymella exigua CBS 183.55]
MQLVNDIVGQASFSLLVDLYSGVPAPWCSSVPRLPLRNHRHGTLCGSLLGSWNTNDRVGDRDEACLIKSETDPDCV